MESYVEQDQYLWGIIDAIPSLVFIVGTDLRIVDANSAARLLFEGDAKLIGSRLCGDVMRCVNAVRSGLACGTAEQCEECIIRTAITTPSPTKTFHRQKYTMVDGVGGAPREMDYLVTASPIDCGDPPLFLLVMEDVTDLTALRHLSTFCSSCNRVKNEAGEWELVHDYLARKDNVISRRETCPFCSG